MRFASTGRYLANQFGLTGNNDWERAEADALVDLINGLSFKIVDLISAYANEEAAAEGTARIEARKKREQTEKNLDEVVLPEILNIIDKRLESSKSGFLVGNGLTWADLVRKKPKL